MGANRYLLASVRFATEGLFADVWGSAVHYRPFLGSILERSARRSVGNFTGHANLRKTLNLSDYISEFLVGQLKRRRFSVNFS